MQNEEPARTAARQRQAAEQRELGTRLKGARVQAGHTLESAAQALTNQGHKIGKAGVGHWETGTNLPDALMLRRLAKLYDTTPDALLWENAVSMAAMKFAAKYDALTEEQKRTLDFVWMSFVESGAPGGEALPPAPSPDPMPESLPKPRHGKPS
jgi:transcriptional regulator with XRE-family HTH domain